MPLKKLKKKGRRPDLTGTLQETESGYRISLWITSEGIQRLRESLVEEEAEEITTSIASSSPSLMKCPSCGEEMLWIKPELAKICKKIIYWTEKLHNLLLKYVKRE